MSYNPHSPYAKAELHLTFWVRKGENLLIPEGPVDPSGMIKINQILSSIVRVINLPEGVILSNSSLDVRDL